MSPFPIHRLNLSLIITALLVLLSGVDAQGAPSTRPGMGAVPYADADETGVTFRVWAPNAQGVAVAGTFNSWQPFNTLLSIEGDGKFSLDVPYAQPGDGYKIVIITDTETIWKNDPRAMDLTSSVGHSIIVDHDAFQWQAANYTPPSWNEMVIYEMHVGTFGLDVGDPVPGNLAGAIEHLDHLESLGVNVIELMPMSEFAGDISWGYNPAYPFSVESAYGSPEDLKIFVDECHNRDIAVFGDLVYNHFGPSDMDIWQFDGWSQNGYGGIYFYNDYRSYTPWGDTRPDFGRPEVRSFLKDNLRMWLDDYRFDGVRVDGTRWIRSLGSSGEEIPEGWSLLVEFNNEIDATTPWKMMVSEDMDSNPWITKTTGEGGAGFDSQWDPWFIHPMRDVMVAGLDNNRSMATVQNAISYSYNGQPFDRVIYTESHDEVANGRSRVPEEIWPGNADSWFSKKRSTLGAAVLMTSPGIPMIFQGQELLEDGYFDDWDPLDWEKAETNQGIVQLYSDLISLRTNRDGISRGLTGPNLNVFHLNETEKVIGWHRWDQGGEGDDVVTLANFRNKTWDEYRVGLPRGGLWKVRFNSDAKIYDSEFDEHPTWDVQAQPIPYDGLDWSAPLSFGAYTSVILSQSPPCLGDLNGSGGIDVDDILQVISGWGGPGGDVNGDGITGVEDLLLVLEKYGACP